MKNTNLYTIKFFNNREFHQTVCCVCFKIEKSKPVNYSIIENRAF